MKMSHEERAMRRKKIAEYASEHGSSSAATEFGVSLGTVRGALQESGVRKTQGHQNASVSSYYILRLLLDGVSRTEIAAKQKITKQRVSHIKMAAQSAGFEFPG